MNAGAVIRAHLSKRGQQSDGERLSAMLGILFRFHMLATHRGVLFAGVLGATFGLTFETQSQADEGQIFCRRFADRRTARMRA